MSNFQLILLTIFGVFIILGVLIFSGIIPLSKSSTTPGASGAVIVWGTVPFNAIANVIGPIGAANKALTISYVQKDAATFDADLTNALAAGNGPDVFFLTSDAIVRNKNKIFPIPYTSLPAATFNANYVSEGGLYLDQTGVLGIPLSLDPLVLYYNPGLFDAAGIATVPTYWDEVLQLTPELTQKDNAGNITVSAIALGQYDNVPNAKDILAMLMMQSGGQLVGIDQEGRYTSTLRRQPTGALLNPGEEAIRFFTEFSNPLKTAYTWNKSLPNAKDLFISGKLAMYIGHASELFTIQGKNPNLNFNVAAVPQIRGNQTKLTYGRMTALAIAKTSKNLAGAVTVAGLMTAKDSSKTFMTVSALAPVRRDIIADKLSDSDPVYMKTFYEASLIARGWLDPNTESTSTIFRNMINNVLSGAEQPSGALGTANDELDFLLQRS